MDIREQYPLDLKETLSIAKQLRIRHPTDPRSKNPMVLTTDFVVSIRKSVTLEDQARTAKYAKDLLSERRLEKLEIERRYWASRKIDWGIVTEWDVDKVAAANIKWFHPYREASSLASLSENIIGRLEATITRRVMEEKIPLRDITNDYDDRLSLPPGSSLSAVRHLLATRKWLIDIRKPIRKIKNALLPSFYRCGGKGKPRVASPHGNKRGRPSKLVIATKQPTGINVDVDISM